MTCRYAFLLSNQCGHQLSSFVCLETRLETVHKCLINACLTTFYWTWLTMFSVCISYSLHSTILECQFLVDTSKIYFDAININVLVVQTAPTHVVAIPVPLAGYFRRGNFVNSSQ